MRDEIERFLEIGTVNLCHAQYDAKRVNEDLFASSMAFNLQQALEKLLKWENWCLHGDQVNSHSINFLLAPLYKTMKIPKIILKYSSLITDWGTRGRYNTSPGVSKEILLEIFAELLNMYKVRGFNILDYA